jgi:hypothetical protein
MNDNEQKKRIIRARLIKLPIFLGIVFLFTWMFRWDIAPSNGTDDEAAIAFILDRWTGTSYICSGRFTQASCVPYRIVFR